jgi:CarD family transcriptional regulator
MFAIGDAVYHPTNGAGVIDNLQRLPALSKDQKYYRICMLDGTATIMMIPVGEAEALGLRRVISPEAVEDVLAVLSSPPAALPTDHKQRHKVCQDRLDASATLEIAEVVRDLAWRQSGLDKLSVPDMRTFKKAMMLLTGELAIAQGLSLQAAEEQIQKTLETQLLEPSGV